MTDLSPEQERAMVAKLERRSTEEQRRLIRFLQPNWSLIAQALKERDQARARALRHLATLALTVDDDGRPTEITERDWHERKTETDTAGRAARLIRHWADKLEAGR